MPSYTERNVNKALAELRDNPETPIRQLADRFNIPRATLQNRLLKTKDTHSGHEKQQLLNSVEELRLVTYVSRASKLGNPITLSILFELAKEIRLNRTLRPSITLDLNSISRRWTERFRKRHPSISAVLTRSIDSQRFNGVNFSALNHYFSELSKVITKERYPLDAIFNVDETGFSLGSSRDIVVLIDKAYKTKGKRQASK
jgi:hypothetical protein